MAIFNSFLYVYQRVNVLQFPEVIPPHFSGYLDPPRPAAAAEDFDAAAELLRLAGRRPEAEIEAERGAVQRMAAEAPFIADGGCFFVGGFVALCSTMNLVYL